jgi:tetratricopeptide (TPR) repeat protein
VRDTAAVIDAAVKLKEKGNSVFENSVLNWETSPNKALGDVAAAMVLYTLAYEMLSRVDPATGEVAYVRAQIQMARCLVNKAQAAVPLGQYQEAVSCCSLALEIDNRNVRTYYGRAFALKGNIYVYICMHAYIKNIHTYIHTYINTYMHTCIYIYIYIHTYMHTYIIHTY